MVLVPQSRQCQQPSMVHLVPGKDAVDSFLSHVLLSYAQISVPFSSSSDFPTRTPQHYEKWDSVLQWEQKFYSSQFIAKAALVNEYIHRFWNVTLLDKLWLPFPRLSLGSMWKDALLLANKWWSSCFEEWGWECHCSQTDAERGAGKTRICVKLQDCWRTSSVS